jgi:hypothetical protein
MSPKVKTTEEKKVGARFLTCNTSKLRGACWSSGMGIKMNDNHVKYSYQFA